MRLSLQDRPPEAQAIRVIHASLDAGVTLNDTANVYCLDDHEPGHNERLVASCTHSNNSKSLQESACTRA